MDKNLKLFFEYVRWCEVNGPKVNQLLDKIQSDDRVDGVREKMHLMFRLGVVFSEEIQRINESTN